MIAANPTNRVKAEAALAGSISGAAAAAPATVHVPCVELLRLVGHRPPPPGALREQPPWSRNESPPLPPTLIVSVDAKGPVEVKLQDMAAPPTISFSSRRLIPATGTPPGFTPLPFPDSACAPFRSMLHEPTDQPSEPSLLTFIMAV